MWIIRPSLINSTLLLELRNESIPSELKTSDIAHLAAKKAIEDANVDPELGLHHCCP